MRRKQPVACALVVMIVLSVAAAADTRPFADWQRDAASGSAAVRRTAARELAAFGAPAVPLLIDLLGDAHLDVRVQAVNSLGRMGTVAQSAAPALVKVLDDRSVHLRRAAALSLGSITPVGDATVAALVRAVADPDIAVQDNATWALRSLGNRALPALTHAMKHPLPQVRLAATGVIAAGLALRSVGPLPDETLARLAEALADDDPDVRAAAARALGNVGRAAEPAVAGLRAVASSDPVNYVRSAAMEAIEKIGSP